MILDEIKKKRFTQMLLDKPRIDIPLVPLRDIEEIFAETKCSNCGHWRGALPTTLAAICDWFCVVIRHDFYCKQFKRSK